METKPEQKTYWQHVHHGSHSLGVWRRASSEEELRNKQNEVPVTDEHVLIGHPYRYENVEGCFGHNGCARMI